MRLAMVGLGRMGSNMVRRLLRAGHECVGYDIDPVARARTTADGAVDVTSLADLAAALAPPRVVWLMLPAAHTNAMVDAVVPHLEPGDVLVDGGNSWYRHDVDRAAALAGTGIHCVDVGVSGGVWGLDRGYCCMVGGSPEAVAILAPVLDALAPGVEAAPRTPGRAGDPAPEERGWLHCGPPGAGHFVKMVHNGIEYALMAAYAEGLNILRHAGVGGEHRAADAETAPLDDAPYYRYDLDVSAVAEVWRRGSVVESWLLDLTAAALHADPGLEGYAGRVSDSGEGRWTVRAAVDESVPAPTITAALYQRFASRGNDVFAGKVLSAMRQQFGGHVERPVAERGQDAEGAP